MYIVIDAVKAQEHGICFMKSDNNVILSPDNIPAKYLIFLELEPKLPCYGGLIFTPDKTQIVLVKTRDNVYGFPKGKRNSGEHSLATALRETYEETGIKPEELTFQQSNTLISEVSASGKQNAIGYFYATTNKIIIKSLDPEEVSASWHTTSIAMDLLQPKRAFALSLVLGLPLNRKKVVS